MANVKGPLCVHISLGHCLPILLWPTRSVSTITWLLDLHRLPSSCGNECFYSHRDLPRAVRWDAAVAYGKKSFKEPAFKKRKKKKTWKPNKRPSFKTALVTAQMSGTVFKSLIGSCLFMIHKHIVIRYDLGNEKYFLFLVNIPLLRKVDAIQWWSGIV